MSRRHPSSMTVRMPPSACRRPHATVVTGTAACGFYAGFIRISSKFLKKNPKWIQRARKGFVFFNAFETRMGSHMHHAYAVSCENPCGFHHPGRHVVSAFPSHALRFILI
jgi:uncharacterized protein YfaT (DUF1175 family)